MNEDVHHYFHNKLLEKLEEFKTYNKHMSKKSKEIEENKKEIVETLKNDPESEVSLEAYEFIYYDHLHISRDINIVATEIYYLSSIATELGLDLDLEAEDKALIRNIGNNIVKKTYTVTGGKIEAVDEDKKDEYLNSLMFKDKLEAMKKLSEELGKQ